MSPLIRKKIASAFAMVSFFIMLAGSLLMGATIETALLRAILGAVVFGPLIYAVSLMFKDENDDAGGYKGGNVNQVI